MATYFHKQQLVLLFLFTNNAHGLPIIRPWLAFQPHLPLNGRIGVCGTPQIYNVVVLLRLTPLDITEAKDAMMLWMFDQVSRTLHDRASQVEGENLYNLFMVERYLPSDEFIEAVDGLTVVQKTHIGELSIGGRNLELDQIINGVILSLPDEVQVKARNFMMLMNTLVCLHSSLQEPPYY